MTRGDAMPKGVQTKDKGCDLYEKCLECPLPSCRYDVQAPRQDHAARRDAIREAARPGITHTALAEQFGVSLNTVKRALKSELADA